MTLKHQLISNYNFKFNPFCDGLNLELN